MTYKSFSFFSIPLFPKTFLMSFKSFTKLSMHHHLIFRNAKMDLICKNGLDLFTFNLYHFNGATEIIVSGISRESVLR